MDEAYDEESYRHFLDQLDDDLNTPNAYTVIFDTVKKLNQTMRVREIDFDALKKIRNSIVKMLDVLGITVEKTVLDEEEKALYNSWTDAKKEKNFALADEIRGKLSAKGLL